MRARSNIGEFKPIRIWQMVMVQRLVTAPGVTRMLAGREAARGNCEERENAAKSIS